MSFLKQEDGSIKWFNTVSVGLLSLVALAAILIAFLYEPKQDEQAVTISMTPNIVYYNYFTVEADETPFDLTGCQMLNLNAGGYALVCPK